MTRMAWSDDRVQILKVMWREGHTGGQIAQLLGITRSMVIAKARRLNLTPRRSPIIRKDQQDKIPKMARRTGKNLFRVKMNVKGQAAPYRAIKPAAKSDTTRLSQVFKEASPSRRQCHYIDGDHREEWQWCLQPVKEDSSYCAYHHGLCHMPPSPRGERK